MGLKSWAKKRKEELEDAYKAATALVSGEGDFGESVEKLGKSLTDIGTLGATDLSKEEKETPILADEGPKFDEEAELKKKRLAEREKLREKMRGAPGRGQTILTRRQPMTSILGQ